MNCLFAGRAKLSARGRTCPLTPYTHLQLLLARGKSSHDLLVDELLQLLLAQVVFVLVEVEEFLRDRRRGGLVIRIMVRLKVRVLQGLVDRDALHGVEGQELLQQVEGEVGGLGEESAEWYLLLEGKGANVLACAAGLDPIVVLHGGCAKDIKDEGELMVVFRLSITGLYVS